MCSISRIDGIRKSMEALAAQTQLIVLDAWQGESGRSEPAFCRESAGL
jgi:hypothetical protein